MPTRLVRLPVRHQLDALAGHVAAVQEHRSVLVITTLHTAADLREAFARHGVDPQRLFIIDAIGSKAGALVSDDPDHLMYVSGPTQLELMALRALKVIQSKAERTAHVLVCTANSFARYNSPAALEEMVRYVVTGLLHPKATLEVLVEEGLPLDVGLDAFLHTFLDEAVDLRQASHLHAMAHR
jgi:KaiC/GvpD/RAD55 family RecA-like ATPase